MVLGPEPNRLAVAGRRAVDAQRMQVEGYPGLVVHGPLIATLLMDLLRRQRPDATVRSFEFRAVRPTFALHPFAVNGTPSADGKNVHLWAQDHEGWLTMDATATLR